MGQWIGPDGNSIPDTTPDGEDGFYVNRATGSISLNKQGSSIAGGQYCCNVPRLGNANGTVCVTVTSKSTSSTVSVIMIYLYSISGSWWW